MNGVLLGQAYFLRFDPKLWDARQPYAPLGTLYAAAWLREHGHQVHVFDAMLAASEAEWGVALDRHQPRVAVLYEDSFNYLSKMCLLRMREAALAMIDMARARGCVTVVAGSDATDHPGIYLERGADAVIAGEGELTLEALVTACANGRPASFSEIAGLWVAGPDGSPQRTAARERLRDLDALPRPAWDLIDVSRYRDVWMAHHGYFSMNLVTTRGCPYHCNWCARPVYGQRYTSRSPERVVEDIRWLVERYRPDHLNFVDDIFGLRPDWIARYAELMRDMGDPVPFRCLVRADLLEPPIVHALARAGCRTVWIGAESGSQRVLDAMEKGTTVAEIEGATRRLQAAGVDVGWFLQFGYPGETRADIALTQALLRRCLPDDIGISVSYPLPGTKFHDEVRAELGRQQNWHDSNDLAMMYRGPFSTAFYRQLHVVVHAEFRVRRVAAEFARLARRPLALRPGRHVRMLASAVRRGMTLPWERRRLERLAASFRTREQAP